MRCARGLGGVVLKNNMTLLPRSFARAVPVTVGLWKDTDWIILSGLEAGDKVVTDQIQRMRDKQPVTLVEKK